MLLLAFILFYFMLICADGITGRSHNTLRADALLEL